MKKIYEVDLNLKTQNAEAKLKQIDQKFKRIEKSMQKQNTSARQATTTLNKGLESAIKLNDKLNLAMQKAVLASEKFKKNITGGLKTGLKLAGGIALGVLAAAGAMLGMVKGSMQQKQSGIMGGLSQRSKNATEFAEKQSGGVQFDFAGIASSLLSAEGRQQASSISGLSTDKINEMLKNGDTANILRAVQKGLKERIKGYDNTQASAMIQGLQNSGLNIGESAESFLLNSQKGSHDTYWSAYDSSFKSHTEDFNKKNKAEQAYNNAMDKFQAMLQNLVTNILPPLISAFEFLAKVASAVGNALRAVIEKIMSWIPESVTNGFKEIWEWGTGKVEQGINYVANLGNDNSKTQQVAVKGEVTIKDQNGKILGKGELEQSAIQNGGKR